MNCVTVRQFLTPNPKSSAVRKDSVAINLDDLSETAEDVEPVISKVCDLGLTLDVGQLNLHGPINESNFDYRGKYNISVQVRQNLR